MDPSRTAESISRAWWLTCVAMDLYHRLSMTIPVALFGMSSGNEVHLPDTDAGAIRMVLHP